jgi:hypothetical protein
MKTSLDKFLHLPVYVHILAVAGVTCILVFIVLKGIDVYTNHNRAVQVPDVIGLQVEDAKEFFVRNKLRYEIVDSVYSKSETPGAIIELRPTANSRVKKNRIVYMTVNAKSEETTPLPEVTDISFREALALLQARGFKDIEWKYVKSDFRDLAVGVEYGGQVAPSGMRVPLTAKLILLIGDGNITPEDSISTEKPEIIGGDESWF